MEKHPDQLVHAVFGSTELLMFDIDRVIIGVDLDKASFAWLSKKMVLQDLQLTDDQFLDACCFAGFEYCGTFPVLPTDSMTFSFKMVHDCIRQNKTGYNLATVYQEHPEIVKQKWLDLFCRSKSAIKYHPVLTDSGKVEPLNVEHAPNDIHEFIGAHLPDQVFHYLTHGLIGPHILNTLVSGQYLEYAPLCNGESEEYRSFLGKLIMVRATALAIVASELSDFFKTRRVVLVTWWEPNTDILIYHDKITISNESEWNFEKFSLRDELKGEKATLTITDFAV